MVKISKPIAEYGSGEFREDSYLHWQAQQPGHNFEFSSQYPEAVVFHSQREDEGLLTLTLLRDEAGTFTSAQLCALGDPHFPESISVAEAQALILPAARQEWYAQDWRQAIENNKTTDADPSEKEPAWIKEARRDYLEAEPATAQEIREKVARQQAMRPLGIEGHQAYSERVPRDTPERVLVATGEDQSLRLAEAQKPESEAYRIGYLLQMQRLEDGAKPETMQDAVKMAGDATAMAPDAQLIERMSARKPESEILVNADFQRDMVEGQRDAAVDWVGEHKNKLDMADSLTAWTKTQDTSKFEIAEVAMARNLVRQMVDGNGEIDLTQKYATDMDTAAQHRHSMAVENLAEYIQRATELGFSVNPGQALTQGLKISEVLAVSERIKA